MLRFLRQIRKTLMEQNKIRTYILYTTWETGDWHAYSADDPNEESPIFNGNYEAQWIHQSGEWKIQSQLFVTL